VENLVPIGRFSKVCRLSVKALRHYDEIGLLEPAVVDPPSGYRYYRPSQANQAEAIRALRSLDMPLEEIREILAAEDPGAAAEVLDRHRGRLADELDRNRRMLAFLERLIARKEGVMPYEVTVKELAPQQVAALKRRTSLKSIGATIGEAFATLMTTMGKAGVAPAGPPFIVYHEVIDEETDGDIEICVPVSRSFEAEGDVRVAEVAGGPVASTVHHGPYAEIGPAYHTLTGWIQDHGHEIGGPPREVYLTDPSGTSDPADNITEIDFPIR